MHRLLYIILYIVMMYAQITIYYIIYSNDFFYFRIQHSTVNKVRLRQNEECTGKYGWMDRQIDK